MTFKSSSSSGEGTPLGMAGYFYRLLELIGFCIGVVIPCCVVFGKPYCRPCQKYLKPYVSRSISSPTMVADWKKTPRKERPAFLEAGINELIASVQPLLTSLGTLPLDEVRSAVESSGEIKSVKGSIGSIKVDVKKCPICDSHHISAAITNITNNKKPKTTSIATINKPEQPVAPVIA